MSDATGTAPKNVEGGIPNLDKHIEALERMRFDELDSKIGRTSAEATEFAALAERLIHTGNARVLEVYNRHLALGLRERADTRVMVASPSNTFETDPEAKGYTDVIAEAGVFTHGELVNRHTNYNDGWGAIEVRAEIVERLPTVKGRLPSTPVVWGTLCGAAVAPPARWPGIVVKAWSKPKAKAKPAKRGW